MFFSRRPEHHDGELTGRGGKQPTPTCREARRPPEPRVREIRGVHHDGAGGHVRSLLLRVPDDLPLHGAPLLHDLARRRHSDAGPDACTNTTKRLCKLVYGQSNYSYLR